ncbi:LON peptidase N-terminal domain and RING finger protein 3-like [Forsythia ovata]|uniref:LON peptidase N-terminal domain and RING finger protein 3-like n=1 Tax=Forsythia ovata TaxID=205694 RepID=A0ABD1PHM3_9LAMI
MHKLPKHGWQIMHALNKGQNAFMGKWERQNSAWIFFPITKRSIDSSMPLNLDLNLPASSDDLDTDLELAQPNELPRTSQEPARDQASNKSTRSRRTRHFEEAGGSQTDQSASSGASGSGSRRRRVSRGQRCDGGEGDDQDQNQGSQSAPQPIPPIFSCPICMQEIIEETSTKCGHIFCRLCILNAIVAQGKCPTCRRKVKVKEIFRIYFPRSE